MIVALCGRKGTGKNTAASYLAQHYGLWPYALAQPLKEALAVMFEFDMDQLFGEARDELDMRYGVTPREMLQTLGTEWGQHTLRDRFPLFAMTTGRDLWVKRFYYTYWRPGKDFVITDVRFQHELDALQDIDDVTSVLLTNDKESTDTHESEELDLNVDAAINNNGTLEQLHESLDVLMRGDI